VSAGSSRLTNLQAAVILSACVMGSLFLLLLRSAARSASLSVPEKTCASIAPLHLAVS
jgi:hypothetical protein